MQQLIVPRGLAIALRGCGTLLGPAALLVCLCAGRPAWSEAPARSHGTSSVCPTALGRTTEPWSLLAEGFEARFPARTTVEHHRRVKLTKDEAPATLGRSGLSNDSSEPPPPLEYTVVERSGWPRIVVEQGHVRALLYVDPKDLKLLPIATIDVRGQPGAPPSQGIGLVLFPGSWVDVLHRRGAWIRVRLLDELVEIEGWVPAAAMGTVYVPAATVDGPALAKSVRAGAALLAGPGGKIIGHFTGPTSVRVDDVPSGKPSPMFRQISFERNAVVNEHEQQVSRRLHYRVSGYVKAEDIQDGPGIERRAASGGPASGSSHLTPLPAGTPLYAGIDGVGVAVVLPDGDFLIRPSERPPWIKVSIDTFWGKLSLMACDEN